MGEKGEKMNKKAFAWITVFLLLNATNAFAFSSGTAFLEENKQKVERANYTCSIAGMTDEESQKILELLADGLIGKEIGSGTKPNPNRELLEQPTIIVPLEGDKAAKVELAREKFDVVEMQHLLNDNIYGAYSFGLVLDDTLRVGRCNDLEDKNLSCPLTEKNLNFRNSGTAFNKEVGKVADFFSNLPLINKLKKEEKSTAIEDLSEEDLKRIAMETGIADEKIDKNAVQQFTDNLVLSDLNDSNIEGYVRLNKEMIPNSILADNFSASSQTNTSQGIISVYSLFDKLYNKWFSGDMVLSLAAPALWFRAKKLFLQFGRPGRFPWRVSQSALADKIRMKFFGPDSFLGRRRSQRIWARAAQYPDAAKLRYELTEVLDGGWTDACYLAQSRAFRKKFEKEWINRGGWFDQITDPKTREGIYKMAKDIRGVVRTNNAFYKEARRQYEKVLKRYGFGSAMERQARIDYGRKISKILTSYEDLIHMDMPEYMSRFEPLHFFQYAVRNPGTQAYQWLPDDSVDMYQIMQKFAKDGHWGGMTQYETAGRNLNLYKVSPTSPKWCEVSLADLEKHYSHYADWTVKIDSGEVLPIKDWSMPKIKYTLTGTKPGHGAQMAKAMELTPEEFAKRLMHGRVGLMVGEYPMRNSERLVDAMIHRGFMGRRFTSILDMAIQRQNQLLKDYFSLKGAVKWSAYTNAYWFAKRGGNQKWASGYMLPDVWREIKWYTGDDPLYNDAFIDFFANAGSDQGDLFNKMLQMLPWEFLAKNVFAQFKPMNDMYEKFKNKQLRDKVENLAFYSNSEPDCTECGINLSASQMLSFNPNFYAAQGTTSYVLEDTVSEKAREKGTTLISFSRHMNLKGKEEGFPEEGEINLKQALREGNSCRQKVQDILPGKAMNLVCEKVFHKKCQPSTIGGVMAFGESVSYVVFGWSAIFASALQQLYYAPKVQDCVDVDEGYYVHIFAPSKEEKKGSEAPSQLSTEKVAQMTQQGFENLMALFSSDENTYTSQAAKKLDESVKRFVEGTQSDDLVQARIETEQFSSGILKSNRLFSFWFKGETNPSSFKSNGKKIIGQPDANKFIEVNFKEGKVFYVVDENGITKKITIIDNNIVTAMDSTNLNIPAEEFPKRLTVLGLPSKKELIFEMNIDSDLIVKSPDVLDCIKQGVLEQTGLEFSSYGRESGNLSSVFGKVVNIVTTTHPTIKAWKEKQRIVAEGTPRTMVEGPNAKVQIYSDRNTMLTNNETKHVGLLKSIIFENGLILYKPYSNELIIWLKRNSQATVSQEDVEGIKTKLTETTNPETNCPEPAIDIAAIPVTGSDLKAQKVEMFNESLQKMGPFQVFETPTRRFVFYSKLVDGECKDFIKIINKKTGEVYEAPIESIKQTSEGVQVTDGNGKEHNLAFSAENGIPTITYNAFPPETLTMAQGKNGAFWYDPETGMWYSENGQLIPLIEAFRKGSLTQVGKNGEVVSRPGDNILNVQTGAQSPGLWNLPSLPESTLELIFFISMLVGAIVLVRRRIFIVLKQGP